MHKLDAFTRTLAIAGTTLVGFPLLAPFLFSAMLFSARGVFRFDYLIPAELFPLVLAGGLLLVWAARRAARGPGPIALALGLALLALLGSQGLAVATGLASGRTEPAGWPWALVLALLALYDLAVVALAASGIGLLRRLFQSSF
jgi:hypothetical protein